MYFQTEICRNCVGGQVAQCVRRRFETIGAETHQTQRSGHHQSLQSVRLAAPTGLWPSLPGQGTAGVPGNRLQLGSNPWQIHSSRHRVARNRCQNWQTAYHSYLGWSEPDGQRNGRRCQFSVTINHKQSQFNQKNNLTQKDNCKITNLHRQQQFQDAW